MKRRSTAVAGVVAFLVLALTSPASAARPAPDDDPAQACENEEKKTNVLEGYCDATGG